ncbi:cell wall biosynthesis glycosyltransferase [Caulobacter vibrioides]|uniref:cell wall biosynthesis glycosyltransferase n=1 Tax=Caulobacter vibrioides TaxID=155892 RepID=UPI000BB5009D|nr:cell wall biosynthesis glycosyltransferase [Caulobacter vibrioides]ATC24264.1 cell wall biosynthesis glycosyltransferase [Caulobacter vibrioides]AZH12510.1 cell wall biosynthesis glycosyltransferase [Caulobacter vibrioides]PLR08272.1 cell wall biosynthesis glycosyltransferase [Caulobacter vibrioides]
MISVVLIASEDLPGLAAQMAMLVPAAVDGLVKEVVLVAGDEPGVAVLAEDSGARLVRVEGDTADRLAAAVAAARGDWILTLRAAPVLREGWREPVERHLAGGAGGAASLVAPSGLLGRLASKMHGVLLRRLDWPAAGTLDEKALAKALKAKAIRY